MKKVFLYGSISEGVGAEWDLMVDSPSEAIRAINCNTDSRFLQNLTDSHLRGEEVVILKVNKEFRKLSEAINESEEFDASLFDDFLVKSSYEIDVQSDFDELHIMPKVDGEIVSGTIAAIGAIGAALSAVSWATVAFSMVAGMIVSGIAAAMFPPVKTNDQTKRTKSYMFGGRENIMEQGGPVPVGYGQLKIGSSTLCFFGQSRFLPKSIDNDTIESYTQYHIQDMISEGPIGGFCDISGNILNSKNGGDGDINWDNNQLIKSIYVNDMPIKNASNQMNLIPAEDNPVRRPLFSLGGPNPSTKVSSGLTIPPNSRVEYESRGAGSALPGPNVGISGFYPEFVSTADETAGSRWGNAKAYTHSITDRDTGMVTLGISSEGQYHNWTDQRVRRRFFSRRVTVDKGTDPVTMAVAVRMFDGKKFVPPILASNGNVLEGVDNVGAAASGEPQTTKYYIQGILTDSDARHRTGRPKPVDADLFRFFVYALFEDDRKIEQVDEDTYNLAGLNYNRKEMLFLFINRAQDFVDFFSSLISYSYSVNNDSNPALFANPNAQTVYSMSGNGLAGDIFTIYFDQNQRLGGQGQQGHLNPERNPSLSSIAVLLAGLNAESSEFGSRRVFLRFYHEIMTFIKHKVVDEDLTLGSDGIIYSTNRKVFYRPADRVRKPSITEQEKASGLWHYTPPVEGDPYDYDDGGDDEYWMVVDASKTISERKFKTLSKTERAGYRLFSKHGHVKNQGIITIKGITTSPASIDYSFVIPYIGPGEAISVQCMRCTAEITDIQQMSTTSKRMSLKTIRRHKTIAGKLMRFEYPNTAWIQTFWDSVNFQQSPNRNYLVKLKKVAVPQNYHTETRSYIGSWNGLFKGERPDSRIKSSSNDHRKLNVPEKFLEWTDNPAWILLDVMLNKRFGIGRFGMTLNDVDIWHLYAAAKFCDELVETGLPLENPKRYFETFNYSSRNKAQTKYLGSKDEYMQPDSFFIRVWGNKLKNELPRGMFLDEYNDSVGDSDSSVGKFIAFFMSDGSIERRKVERVLGITNEQETPDIIIDDDNVEAEEGAQYIQLSGPTFMNSSSTAKDTGRTTGFCCMEKTYPLVEPRFSLNIYYNRQQRALETVRELVSQFKTVLNYVGGRISFSTEKKSDPLMMFTDANVSVDGFGYAGVGRSTRVTAAKVRYLDKFDDYKSKVEYYEDPGGIDKFGYIEEEVVALGCASRGQAQRFAKFTVVAPTLETELVTFTTGMEGALLLPGSIIEVSDSRRFGENVNGRIKSVSPGDHSVKVDKIMSNLSFWNPQTGLDDDRVELCVVTPSGFEDASKLTERTESLQGTPEFNGDDQLALIADVRKSQMVYFDGNISSNKREIVSLEKKEPFSVNKSSDSIIKSNHGLSNGDRLRFSSFGVLPKYEYEDSGNVIEERLSEHLEYFVVDISDREASNSSFKISKHHGGTALDFIDQGFAMRKTFNSDSAVDEGAEISGGEHFYKVRRRKDVRSSTKEALDAIMVGSVWSIRGFKKDVFLRPESISSEIKENFILHASGLGAEQVKGVNGSRFYSEKIGSFILSGFSDTTAGAMISIKQVGSRGDGSVSSSGGLGSVLVNTGKFAETSHVDLMTSLREVKLVDGYTIVVTEGSLATTLYRSSLHTDVFRVIGTSQAGVETPGASNDLYLSIRNKTYLVRKDAGHHYIRLAGIKPTNSQIDEWVKDLAGSQLPNTQAPVTPPQDSIEISIDDFRNVGRRQYRINSVIENGYGKYEVKGSEYNREKFSIIENEISLNRPTLPIPPQVSMEIPLPPKGFKVKDTTYRGLINV